MHPRHELGLIKYNIASQSHPPTSLLLVSSNNMRTINSEQELVYLKHPPTILGHIILNNETHFDDNLNYAYN